MLLYDESALLSLWAAVDSKEVKAPETLVG